MVAGILVGTMVVGSSSWVRVGSSPMPHRGSAMARHDSAPRRRERVLAVAWLLVGVPLLGLVVVVLGALVVRLVELLG